jgi:hypothetical protein
MSNLLGSSAVAALADGMRDLLSNLDGPAGGTPRALTAQAGRP